MILTTSEAADELGVTPFAMWKMVERGELTPINPGRKPHRFRLLDVADAQERRMRLEDRLRLDALAAVLAVRVASCQDSA